MLAVHSSLHFAAGGRTGATAFVLCILDEYSTGEARLFGILKIMLKTWLLDKIQGNTGSLATIVVGHFAAGDWLWCLSLYI